MTKGGSTWSLPENARFAHTRRHIKEYGSLTATDCTLLCRHTSTPGERLEGCKVSGSLKTLLRRNNGENIVLKQYCSNSFGNSSLLIGK